MNGRPSTCRAANAIAHRQLQRRGASSLLGVALAVLLAYFLAAAVGGPPTVYGTASAPASDAYDPWLRGALGYLFFGEPHGSLYRPTIGIFFGSILAVTSRIEAIPVFFAAAFCLFVAYATVKSDPDLRAPLISWLAYALVEFDVALAPLNFGNLMPDPPAFLFTLAGSWAVLMALRTRPMNGRWLAAGFLALGLAATIRGPMMLAGPAMLVFVACLARSRAELRAIFMAAVLFLVPLAIDVAQQRAYGVVNNGLATLFCFYTDPSYSWTTPCHNIYLAKHPPAGEILTNYLRLLAGDGRNIVLGNLDARLYQEGLRMHTAGFRAAVLGLAVFLGTGWALRARTAARGRKVLGATLAVLQARHGFALRVGILALVISYAFAFPHQTLILYVSCAIAAVSVLFRLPRTFLCLGAYWLGAIFLALVTQAHQNRLGLTFSFLLYFALFFAVCEQPREQVARTPAARCREVAPIYAVVAFLYLAVFLYPAHLARAFEREVAKTAAALVVSRDGAKNECLYFNGRREMFYGRCGAEKSVR